MEFKTPTLGDKEFIDSFFEEESTRSCDFSTANIILWNQFYDCQYAVVCDTLVMRTDEEGESFSFPMGKGDKKKSSRGDHEILRRAGHSICHEWDHP